MKKYLYKFGRFTLIIGFAINCSSASFAQTVDHGQRRSKLLEKMQHGIAIFTAAPEVIRNGDVNFDYRQDSNFYYLSGIRTPGTILVFRPDAPKRYVVFIPQRDPIKQIYEGSILSPEEMVENFNADTAYYSYEFDSLFSEWLQGVKKVYHHYSGNNIMERRINRLINKTSIDTLIDAARFVRKMRISKNPDEIALIQRAIDITARAHHEMMKVTEPNKYEYEIEAAIEYVFKTLGSNFPGFPSIVGSGQNSTTLHYIENQKQLRPNELLLVDIGAEFEYYTADITRTVPVNGEFTSEQKAIYSIVLASQEKTIAAIHPGVTIADLHKISAREISQGLVALGILKEDFHTVMNKKLYRKFYPHGVSHHLGLDAHDPDGYSESQANEPLQPGMVITIEPGIYIREDHNVEPRWQNIGIRVEDDILITESGYQVLSETLPRDIQSIERIMSGTSEFFRE